MKVDMNGFRKSLTNEVQSLKEMVAAVIDGSFDDLFDNADLGNCVNQIISSCNVFNSMSDPDDPDFKKMPKDMIEFINLDRDIGRRLGDV